MMICAALAWLWLAVLAFAVLVKLHRRIYRSSDRNIHDSIPFLLEVDADQLEGLLDARHEQNLRGSLSKKEFRKAQQKRMRLFLELLRRMTANAYILLELGRSDRRRGQATGQGEWEQLGGQLARTALEFSSGALPVRLMLHARLIRSALFPFGAAADIAPFRAVGNFNLFDGYQQLVDAAMDLGLAYGDEIQQKLAHAL